MSRPIWLVNLVKKSFPTRFALARFTKAPVVGQAPPAVNDGGRIEYQPGVGVLGHRLDDFGQLVPGGVTVADEKRLDLLGPGGRGAN